ncbi:zinc-dependent metalloprotease [Fodinibius salsisoli]|uniref:Zinc-dependent metalloprotease n=1 Tax=Fodinibius salsisoli TaxID=2820877 RepID=A0ABT3PSN7_9BACT|nr:zinc-dependent metalloprotease [Fodinibius salsisoli]MCW9708851.1 zinc-dependent metalloprotease [Fodinibius salsisoli]
MMKSKLTIVLLCAVVFYGGCASSQKTTSDQQTKTEEQSSKEEYDKLIKDAEQYEGYFDFYQKDSELYLSVSEEQLNKPFLMNFELARGVGASGLYGGTMLNIFEGLLVSFQKHEGKIFLVQHPHRYTAQAGTPQAKAVDLTFGESVVEASEIKAFNADSSRMLVDVYDWFVGDLSGISTRVAYAVGEDGQPGSATFDKGRSHLEKVQAFPENVNIQARLTFKNGKAQNAPRTVADGRYIPVSLFYTMVKLPEEPMKPRMADDRTGYFMTVHKDFTDDSDTFFKRYVNRWRLECKEDVAEGELCTPKKPITYYIDHTVPEEYRQGMMDGVEAWSKAFEAAGFRNAVQAKMLPDSVMAEDIRYATLRWNTSDQPGYGAIGPSVVDPRTGEILDADILFEANMLLNDKEQYRHMVEPRSAIESVFNVSEEELELMSRGVKTKSFYAEMNAQFDLVQSLLIARGELKPGSPVPEEFVHQALKWVTMHEVGHTLGLRHNFRSSIDTPLDKLYDKNWTEENGVFSSAMEYPSVNLNPEGQSNDGYYYNPSVGSYDRWVISYGYATDDTKAEEIARQAAAQGHAYGTDEDARGSGAIDPHVNVYDLGSDPLEWGKGRAGLLRIMIPKVGDITLEDNEAYYKATDLFQSYLYQYARTLIPAIKYIGGQHQYRDHVGDPNGRQPFVPVPKTKQQEALDMLTESAFHPDALMLPKDLYQKLGANRWSHWGNSNTYSGRIDYPLHGTVAGIQQAILGQLLDPVRLARIRDTEVKFGAESTITIPELMGQLTNAIWGEVSSSPGSDITSNRRDLQRTYLDAMTALLIDAPEGTPADARSVARHQLQEVHDMLEARLHPPTQNFDEYTRAHLEESKARIEAALEAGLQLEN